MAVNRLKQCGIPVPKSLSTGDKVQSNRDDIYRFDLTFQVPYDRWNEANPTLKAI